MSNFSSDETKVLRNLTKQKDVIIVILIYFSYIIVIILDKESSFTEKIKKLLCDTSKFERLEIPPDKYFNFVINSKDKIKNIFKSFHDKESLTDMLPGFYMTKLRYTSLSLTIFHLLDLYLMLLIHHRIS